MHQQAFTSYLTAIKDTLDAVLTIRMFPSQKVEKQIHPEIEFQENKELLLQPLYIARN